MSSRYLMNRFMNNNRQGGGGRGILGMLGAGEMSGGLQLAPSGEVSYNPYAPKHPILDRLSGGRTASGAQDLNNIVLMQMLANQMEGQNIKLRGGEDRKTIETQGSETRQSDSNRQILAILQAAGVPDTPENRKLFSAAVSQARIGAAGRQSTLEEEVLTSPERSDAFRRGNVAQMLAPEVANTKNLTVNTGPNSVTTMPTGPGFAPTRPFTTIAGPSESRTMSETDPVRVGDITLPGKPVLETRYDKGSVSYPAPDFESQASQINEVQTMPQQQPQMQFNNPFQSNEQLRMLEELIRMMPRY